MTRSYPRATTRSVSAIILGAQAGTGTGGVGGWPPSTRAPGVRVSVAHSSLNWKQLLMKDGKP